MRWIEKIQERLRVTTTVLGEMKAVKMLGLTDVMSTMIQRLRTDEINTSKSFRKLLVATLLLCKSLVFGDDENVYFLTGNPSAHPY